MGHKPNRGAKKGCKHPSVINCGAITRSLFVECFGKPSVASRCFKGKSYTSLLGM